MDDMTVTINKCHIRRGLKVHCNSIPDLARARIRMLIYFKLKCIVFLCNVYCSIESILVNGRYPFHELAVMVRAI
jgi:hypothetical protein